MKTVDELKGRISVRPATEDDDVDDDVDPEAAQDGIPADAVKADDDD